MQKTILITGSTDGIGREAASMLLSAGHHVLLHGRNPSKLEETENELAALPGYGRVRQAFGVAGGDIRIGAEILTRAALADEFATASGRYYDNDEGRFAAPHADALDPKKSQEIVRTIENLLTANTDRHPAT